MLVPLSRCGFSDSSFFYAAANRRDPYHKQVCQILEQARQYRWGVVTTSFVIAETHALMLSRRGRQKAADWLKYVRPVVFVIRPTETDEERALDIIFRYTDKDFSFTDALSFAVMEQLGIKGAFALDEHFVQYDSFLVLPLQGATLPENG
ncbi:MAG: hypothetical protein HZLCBSQH_001482 [Candidatus Fervidibacterota bacterium]